MDLPAPVSPTMATFVPKGIYDLLRVVHVRLRLQQLGKPLDVDLGRDKIGEGVDQPADRLHHALGIGHEHREGADLAAGDKAAAPQHDGKRERGSKVHRHGEHAAQVGGIDRAAQHIARLGAEIVFDLVLDYKGLNGLRAGNTLVEVAGDL